MHGPSSIGFRRPLVTYKKALGPPLHLLYTPTVDCSHDPESDVTQTMEMPPPTVTLDHYPSPSVNNDDSGGGGHHVCTASRILHGWPLSQLIPVCIPLWQPYWQCPCFSMQLPATMMTVGLPNISSCIIGYICNKFVMLLLCLRHDDDDGNNDHVLSNVNKLAIVILLLGAQNQVVKWPSHTKHVSQYDLPHLVTWCGLVTWWWAAKLSSHNKPK